MKTINQSAPALLQSVLTASQNGVLVFQALRDASGIITDLRLTMLNAIAERDLGRLATDVLGQPFSRLFPHLAETVLHDRYQQVVETGQSERFEFQDNRPGQSTPVWLDISAVRMEDSVVISYTDITQSKTDTEDAQLANVLQRAFDASISGITVYEAIRDMNGQISDFRFAMINEAGQRMSGYTRAELLGRTIWEIYPATGINGLFDQYVHVCETGESFSGEHYYPEYDLWREITIVRVEGGIMVTYIDSTARKKLEETARRQNELLAGVLEQVPVGIAVLNTVRSRDGSTDRVTDFRVVRINSVLQKIMCPLTADVVGRTITTVFDSASESGLLSRCILSIGLGETQEFEVPHAHAGHTNWYRVSISPNGDQLILTFTDITETKSTQLAHHRQAELLQSISDNTPAGLVLWEAVHDDTPERNVIDFRYRMTNLMNTFVTGHSADALIGHRLLEVFPRFQGTEMEAVLHEVLKTGRTQRMIFTYYTERPDGWFDAQFMRVGNEVLMTFMDVTEQHKIQLDQKKQADFVQAVINAQPVGVAVFDPIWPESTNGQPTRPLDFTYALVNETELRITGLSADTMIGQRQKTLFPDPDGLEFFDLLADVAESGNPKEWLLPYVDAGIQGWLQASLMRQGNQVLFTFLDVSELKRQQQALEMANLELRRSNDNLQQFAYVASHDLQEPLRKIQSFGDILATNYAAVLDETAQGMISRMQSASRRMSGLIKDLLDYSRLSTRVAPFEPVSLPILLNETMSDLFVAVRESGATVEWDDLPTVLGDKTQLRQLFQNLLSNAIKFCAPGVSPRIRISCRNLMSADLPLAAMAIAEAGNNKPVYEINLLDNGIGFDEKYLDKIFQVFQRLHVRSEYAGTGVGLAICRKVAENHRGALTATSQPGSGSTFSLYLPVQ